MLQGKINLIEKYASACLAADKREGAAQKDAQHHFEPHLEMLPFDGGGRWRGGRCGDGSNRSETFKAYEFQTNFAMRPPLVSELTEQSLTK